MLTWAMVSLAKARFEMMPIFFLVAMGCDVAIVVSLASGFGRHCS